jgi:quercetin dioxygenase-like cupin family protein
LLCHSLISFAQSAGHGQVVARAGSQAAVMGPSAYFTGSVHIDPLFKEKDGVAYSGAYVLFEPGARSNWHTQPAGQHLIVTAGHGWTQEWGGPLIELRPGDVVWCPPGVKHWHGATWSNSMTHMAITESRDGKNVEWMERLTEQEYPGDGGAK